MYEQIPVNISFPIAFKHLHCHCLYGIPEKIISALLKWLGFFFSPGIKSQLHKLSVDQRVSQWIKRTWNTFWIDHRCCCCYGFTKPEKSKHRSQDQKVAFELTAHWASGTTQNQEQRWHCFKPLPASFLLHSPQDGLIFIWFSSPETPPGLIASTFHHDKDFSKWGEAYNANFTFQFFGFG